MAFKKRGSKQTASTSPDQLFRELPRRQFPDVLPHQQSMMQRYADEAIDRPDVALQLPTGSGKTLVGLLIAEWRRRKFNEKVVYLCPTRQLVNQAAEQSEKKYGLSVTGFTGSNKNYDPSDVAKYNQGMSVAVTTYSSVFNTNPFFDSPDVIIVDDAHAAENYVSTLWSLEIERFNDSHKTIHEALCSLLRPYLDASSFSRLTGKWDSPTDKGWVDKLPTPILHQIQEELMEVLDEYIGNSDLKFPWSMIRSHFHACHLYLSSKSLLIRPLLPPTWAHDAFSGAKQRIYMSATLGNGGDLERLTGRKNIYRLATPEGWDTQGVGRRFFIFPSFSLKESEGEEFNLELFKLSDRSLVLVPSDIHCASIIEKIEEKTELSVFISDDIEESKEEFVGAKGAVAVVANRYDGIDFPKDECRLLVIEGLPKSVNNQEQFLMSRIGANVLFNERIQTRVIQAIGRCTRSLEDYSTVVVNGNELAEFLANKDRRNYFHPELQAELEFGVEQSIDSTYKDLIENYEIFIENGEGWEDINSKIVDIRGEKTQVEFPGIDDLSVSVSHEIDYVKSLWGGDFEQALQHAEAALGALTHRELKGYRAWWEYLAGSAAYVADKEGIVNLGQKALEHFVRAKRAAKNIPWLASLSNYVSGSETDPSEEINALIMKQVEGVEAFLASVGSMHERKYSQKEKKVREGLNSEEGFEEAHRLLGELLGFESRKVEDDASPDPWWQIGDLCFVFEDHANAENDTLSPTKARQVSSHPNWMRVNVDSCKEPNVEIIPVLVSPVTKMTKGAAPQLNNVKLWRLEEFKEWAKVALEIIRELRSTFQQSGDLVWRAEAAARLVASKVDVDSLKAALESQPCRDFLEVK
ncbi:DEAD/DEAH box helicase [Candidatus Endobugula sertula]|uniref:DEAD/DEAH box helicase n=1 Tax=Candidatus Endobugula sertula TaxID=62101 RepID=A0A1D2QNZ9_9GAMM|nr:DEAD/DEAH box helicase [Candidatus Endobugula sertula]